MSNTAEDFFQQLADGAPVMIWMSGLDMGCFYFNRAWLDFRGRTLEQEAGNGWAEGVHPEDLQRCVGHYVSCFERRIAFAMSYRLLDASGRYQWILDRGAPHALPDGTFLGFFGGCAEIASEAPSARSAELRSTLAELRIFARHLAAGEIALGHAGKGSLALPLQALARKLHENRLEHAQHVKHAAVELEQLATAMLDYARIPRGVCIPVTP